MDSAENRDSGGSANQQEADFRTVSTPQNRKKGVPWQFRAICVALGSWAIAAGFKDYYSGQHWFALHSGRTGWQIRPTLDIAIMGLLFVVFGILPWGWFARRSEQKQQRLADRLTSTTSRHQPRESDR